MGEQLSISILQNCNTSSKMGGLLFNLSSKLVWGIKTDFIADTTGNGHEKDILIAFC